MNLEKLNMLMGMETMLVERTGPVWDKVKQAVKREIEEEVGCTFAGEPIMRAIPSEQLEEPADPPIFPAESGVQIQEEGETINPRRL